MATNTGSIGNIGHIYYIRHSVKAAIDNARGNSGGSFISSSCDSSSATTAKKKNQRPRSRGCLLWDVTENNYILLLITTFNKKNPAVDGDVAKSLMMTTEELIKIIIPIAPSPSIAGQPTLNFKVPPSPGEILNPSKCSYLLLLPVHTPVVFQLPQPSNARFENENLLMINTLIYQLNYDLLIKEEMAMLKEEVEMYKNKSQTNTKVFFVEQKKRDIDERKLQLLETKNNRQTLLEKSWMKLDESCEKSSNDSDLPHPLCDSQQVNKEHFSDEEDSIEELAEIIKNGAIQCESTVCRIQRWLRDASPEWERKNDDFKILSESILSIIDGDNTNRLVNEEYLGEDDDQSFFDTFE